MIMKYIKRIILMLAIFAINISGYAQHIGETTGFRMPALNPKSPLADVSGSHVGIRVPDYTSAIQWWTDKLDFRVLHEWDYADEKLAYLAPANDNGFWIEILAEGKLNTKNKHTDLGKSLEEAGFHHICIHVKNLDKTLEELKKRGVTIISEPFYLEDITRKLAFISDPWGNMIELSEVVNQTQTNKELVEYHFQKWSNGTGNFFDLLDENVQWEITGSTPFSKIYTSKKQFLDEVIIPLNERLKSKIKPTVRNIYEDGDMVIALWDGEAIAKDGKRYRSSYSWYMEMKQGKIIKVVAFLDGTEFADIMKRIPEK